MDFVKEYNKDLASSRKNEYKISTVDFKAWLSNNSMGKDIFKKSLATIENEKDLYRIAFDFSIPVVMVKYFKK